MALLMKVMQGSSLLLGMGLCVGIVNMMRKPVEGTTNIHIPGSLDSLESLKEALVTLSETKDAHKEELERVCRRCASLLHAYLAVCNADAKTVKPSIIALGSKYMASIKSHLQNFYTLSGVPLVQVDRQLLPVNTDMKHAHETIIITLECLIDSLELAAREKLEMGVAERV